MKAFIEIVGGAILICPLIALVLVYMISRKMRMKKMHAVGFAADITTFILFFSVPLAFKSIWGASFSYHLIIVALLIALGLTFLDWRTKKEIDVPVLLKKIWRIYFIMLSILYITSWVVGLVLNIIEYLKGS